MNAIVERYWDKKKERLKIKFPVISDKDLHYRQGSEKEMLELLSYKLGKTEQEMLSIIIML